MSSTTLELQKALHAELLRLQSIAELGLTATNHLTGLALNPETKRPDLVPESTVVKEIATLLQHAVQNLARYVGPAPADDCAPRRGNSRGKIAQKRTGHESIIPTPTEP